MKPRTEEEVTDRLAADLIWRKKEMTILRKLVESASPDRREALRRALVAMTYAHWEGFIKNAASTYLRFVSVRRLQYRELAPNFLAYALRGEFRNAVMQKNLQKMIELVGRVRSGGGDRLGSPLEEMETANLSSSVLRDIATALGVDYSSFELKEFIIDERLLKVRNAVAHGERLPLEEDDIIGLVEEVQQMMEEFRALIENAVSTRSYRV